VSFRLAVVVPTHQRRDLVLGLMRALCAQTLPASAFEVVIVCDGSTDGSAEAAIGEARGLMLSVIEQVRSGAATARNRGAGSTTAPVIVFLDDDMVPAPDCLAAHEATHAAHPGALVLGHMPVHPNSPRSFLTEGLARWAGRRHARLSAPGASPRFDDVLTGHLSIARATFSRLGGFDPAFTAGGTFGGEDIEFGWRALEAGIPVVYAADAVAEQVFAKGFRALARDIRHGALADAALERKHAGVTGLAPGGAAFALSRRFPRLASAAAEPLVALLDRAARRGATGPGWEALHDLTRRVLAGSARSLPPPA
jgi:glycosyltransferase involved in cell wall biosynthesis